MTDALEKRSGAILDPLTYQVLLDWFTAHHSPRIDIVPVEDATEDEMLASRQIQRALALTRGESIEPDPEDPYAFFFHRPYVEQDNNKD